MHRFHPNTSFTMRRLTFFLPLLLAPTAILAGESSLTLTWQPLSTLGGGGIRICEVACHDWYGHSGANTAVQLISARNVPPSNNPKEATDDLNLASASGLAFSCTDPESDEKQELTLDATKFESPGALAEEDDRENIVRSALECLRRVTAQPPYSKLPLTLKASDNHKAWLTPIVAQFNKHDRTKVFYTPEE